MYSRDDNYFGIRGYEIYFTRYADTLLETKFPQAKSELTKILSAFDIPKNLIVAGGGGKSKITQSLEAELNKVKWKKKKVLDEHFVDGNKVVSESHEIDHYKVLTEGSIGLEIEWNNKDPFYDRDLVNFRKLHYIGAIGLGIIITRGASLQNEFINVYKDFLSNNLPLNEQKLKAKLRISDGLAKTIKPALSSAPQDVDFIASKVLASKFGQATTHMTKLLLRIERGLGNPCPLILIGIGKDKLV